MGCCSSGGGSSGTTSIYTSNELPGWVNDAAKANYGEAQTLAARPYPTYTGQRIAQFNPDQQQAMTMGREAVGQWDPLMQQAGQVATGVATSSLPGANLQAYMDPYRQQVIDTTMQEANRQGDIERQRIARGAPSASAWAGDRQAIMESEHGRNMQDTSNRMVAGLNSAAYDKAVQAWNADRASQLQGANLMGNLAGAGQALGFADVNALLQLGGMQQSQEQANLDLGWSDFLNQQNYPMEMLNWKTSMLGAQPYNTSSMQTSKGAETPRSNFIAQLLGGGAALAGATNQWF